MQHLASHCNTLQHTATQEFYASADRRMRRSGYAISLHFTVTHCNTMQHTATHCNTLQYTAAHCNAGNMCVSSIFACPAAATPSHGSALQHLTTHCNTLQHRKYVRQQIVACAAAATPTHLLPQLLLRAPTFRTQSCAISSLLRHCR